MTDGTANGIIEYRGIPKTNTGPVGNGPLNLFPDGVVGGSINWSAIESFRKAFDDGGGR